MYLSDIRYSWPFNRTAPQNLEDKEVLSHWISQNESMSTWRIPIPKAMEGFTYLAFRCIEPSDSTGIGVTTANLVHTLTEKPVFSWVPPTQFKMNEWTPFAFPIVPSFIQSGMDLVIRHSSDKWGKIEILSQKLDDFPLIQGFSYAFVDTIVNKITMISTPEEGLCMPTMERWPYKTKLLPPLKRVLDPFRSEWVDKSCYWNGVDLKRSF